MFQLHLSLLDWLAMLWFAVCWLGYTRYSGFHSPRPRKRLQDALYVHIRAWIATLHQRDNRIVDTAVITNIERSATFLASSSLLIIAGIMTALASTEKVTNFMSGLPLVTANHPQRWEIGLLLMLMAFVYAFFTFTWCMRQWGFASILIGNTPEKSDERISSSQRLEHQEALAHVIWLAIYHFNAGLRAYYFSLALLAWFLHPIAFMITSSWVVAVLYRREFHSHTLDALLSANPLAQKDTHPTTPEQDQN
ncbi:MAG: hypothetical protein CR991_04930 [Proteobacteria bacterium]|nr:MAG: hypothetical protein CR991_04930 [Pseudomonadota bacterium]